MMTRAKRHERRRTRAAEQEADSLERGVYAFVAIIIAIGFFVALGKCVDSHVPGGIIVGGLAILISAGMLAYWWKLYRDRGLTTKPRISFREVYVLYFGMSVEVGLIVHAVAGHADLGAYAAALFLPPALIGAIAAIDDTPYDRNAQRRVLPRGVARKALAAPELQLPTAPATAAPAASCRSCRRTPHDEPS